jgi:RNA polymerase sigma-70 factor (ECF subfamily)
MGFPLHRTAAFASIIRVEGRVHAGPQRAVDRLEALYAAHGALVYARCRHILRDAAAAEDITQETFLRAYRSLSALTDAERILPWLYRVATNLCLNALRDGRTRPLLLERLPDRASPEGLDDTFANRELCARLIARVSRKLAVAAWLFYVDGMRQEEIADVLGISRRAVAKRLAQFTEKSRKFLRTEARGG